MVQLDETIYQAMCLKQEVQDARILELEARVNLGGQWALVGGASQGIGQATAQVLAACGARVILMSRRLDVLEATRATLPDPNRTPFRP